MTEIINKTDEIENTLKAGPSKPKRKIMKKYKLSDFVCELDVECKPQFLKLPNGKQIVLRIPIKASSVYIDYLYDLCKKPGFDGDASVLIEGLENEFPDLSHDEVMKIFFLFKLTIPS